VIHAVAVGQRGQLGPRHPGRVQHGLLLGRAGESPELLDHIPHIPIGPSILIVADVRGQQTLEILNPVPVGTGWQVGLPLLPVRGGSPDRGLLPEPVHGECQVGVEEGEVGGQL